jgi:hypothetical protein
LAAAVTLPKVSTVIFVDVYEPAVTPVVVIANAVFGTTVHAVLVVLYWYRIPLTDAVCPSVGDVGKAIYYS